MHLIQKIKNSPKWYWLLLGYHFLFIYFAFTYRLQRGRSDATLYWFQNAYTSGKSWLDFLNYGADFLLFLNYPLVAIGLPYWFAFLLYGTIGFLGCLQWFKWAQFVAGSKTVFRNKTILLCVFLLPNLHYWTAGLGKEPILFLGISTFFYALSTHNFKSLQFILGSIIILLIRPHLAMILFAALLTGLFFLKDTNLKKRISLFLSCLLVSALSFYMVLQLSGIRYFSWKRILYFNEYSILSFRNSGSYVPMLEYNYFYKWFTFHFRPLFFDVHSIPMFFASIENLILLLISILTILVCLRYFSQLRFPFWMKVTFIFSILVTTIYIERYANLGIFMRTKMMFQPFLLIACLHLIAQGYSIYKSKQL